MAIEIKELVIRAVVEDESANKPAASHTSSPSEGQEELVRRAVEEVLRILKASRER